MISDELHLDVSFNTLQRFPIHQQAELESNIQLINSSNYNFPAKHYNLSIVDARYLQNHTDEILRTLQLQSDLYEAPSNYGHNENMGTRAKMAKYPSRHAMTFLQFIKNLRKLNEELIDWYHNNYQVVYYAEYNN